MPPLRCDRSYKISMLHVEERTKPWCEIPPKKPSGPKHIVCHHCGAFGHLKPHCSKFQAFKRIKRKEKLKLFGRCAMKAKPNLGENCMLLKQVVNALTSLSMCISGSHSSNPRLTSHETLIPNNHSVWMRKCSFG